ncbi:hypothetical protein [Tritonibacter scottomollicae]|uniref:hypothetical protein n=1 Tax=Tritonibacter scottomollicae TaxID=483013 RepID=UPI003BA854BE
MARYREKELIGTREVLAAFLFMDKEDFLVPLSSFTQSDSPWRLSTASAIEGLGSVLSAATLPLALTHDAVSSSLLQRFDSAAQIRNLKNFSAGEKPTAESQIAAYRSAKKQAQDFSSSEKGRAKIRDDIIDILASHLYTDALQIAAEQLLAQTVIGTWTVFETFVRSIATDWVNAVPASASSILNAKELKDDIGKQPISFDTLSSHGFDLSKKMGNALFDGKRLDRFRVMKGVLKALFGTAEVQRSLGHGLHLLNQERNLLVHNRGVVDADFKEMTGSESPIGEKLSIEADSVEASLLAVRTAIVAVLSAAETKFSESHH